MPDDFMEITDARQLPEGALAPLGHNLPGDADFVALVERVGDLVATANRWAIERPVITDAEMAKRCQDFLDQVGTDGGKGSGCLGQLRDLHKAEKAPHLAAATVVDTRYAPLRAKLSAIKDVLAPRRATWLRAEQDRLDAERRAREEEARRIREEAEAAAREAEEMASGPVIENKVRADELAKQAEEAEAAVTRVPDRAILRGDYGTRGRGLRTVWYAEPPTTVAGWNELYRHLRDTRGLHDEMIRLANAEVRSGARQIPGCQVKSRQE